MQERWSAVDEYVARLLAPHDPALEAAQSASDAAGLPAIQVSPPQGKLLNLLARSIGAKTILEFGTLGAYSTIWLGWALPEGGRLVTLEADPGYAKVAHENIARAGLEDVVDLRVGAALDLLPDLHAEGIGPFDFTFIDADKENSPAYFSWALERSRPGGLIVADKRGSRRHPGGRWQRGPEGASPAPPARDDRRRESRQRDDDPDGRRQGL